MSNRNQRDQDLIEAHEFIRTTNVEARRREARGKAVIAQVENIELFQKNNALTKETEALKQKNQELEQKLEAVSALAKTRFVDSEALRKTIVHLENAWGKENPQSKALSETSDNLDNVHRNAYVDMWNDPQTNIKFNAEIKKSEERQAAKKRSRLGR